LTALWLWTLKAAEDAQGTGSEDSVEHEEDDDDNQPSRRLPAGFALDYDTARKLAQALGAHLEDLGDTTGVVEVEGATARLRSVSERRATLMSTNDDQAQVLFDAAGFGGTPAVPGLTTLDRLHRAMILFGDGRGEALRLLLSTDGYVADERFMRLARSLSALYPAASQEKRWLDGVIGAARGVR
jgi:hypothetical protein